MVATAEQREKIERDLAARLSGEKEVRKVIVFGSFLTSATPNDLDVAIFQDSGEPSLSLALKYRRLLVVGGWLLVVGWVPLPVTHNEEPSTILAQRPIPDGNLQRGGRL
jgi:hypothetical protein